MTNYTLKETKSGEFTLIYKGPEENFKEIRLHSAYDPVKEAERSTAAFDRGRSSVIAVSGLGLGFHLAGLKEKHPGIPLIAVEHDREVIDIVLDKYPGHLEDVILINSSQDLSKIFEEIDMGRFRGIAHYIHRPSHRIYSDFYDSIAADIARYLSSKVSDLLTRFQFEETWIENILQNIHNVFSSPTVKDLFGAFKGCPGIIVSAGPSLRKSLDHLNAIKDKSLIVCVDTALKVLHKKKISPHIVMTLDAQTHTAKHFSGIDGSNTALLADLVSCPVVTRSYRGKKIFSTTSKYYTNDAGETKRETTPLMGWIEKFVPPIGDIQSGGSVATSAFDLLLNLGCSPIILVGQDLAYTGREIHCSGTHHNDDWLPITSRFINLDTINQKVIRKRKIQYVDAFGGKETVISDFVFDLYKGWFEDSAGKVGVPVINASEGGARIMNTKEETLESLARRLPVPAVSPAAIIEKLMLKSDTAGSRKLHDGIIDTSRDIKKINSIAKNNSETDMLALIDDAGLSDMYNPFLRKSLTYISRHDLPPEKAADILNQDIILASEKLLPMLNQCLETL
ncbi:MAG: motility associated factor glycosyltransferase family protein [bacterium]|nr:motility associated factor glycosyltransferase family protein [bacterium]